MNIFVMTSNRKGIASRALASLKACASIESIFVIFANNNSSYSWNKIQRKFKKTIKIGCLGAINGVFLRQWYVDKKSEPIENVCASLGIEYFEAPEINCDFTRKIIRDKQPDLGLSLGNGYIAKSVFSLPRMGMINLHTEILPGFKGAQSIIWPIFEGLSETGFSIHQINSRIDDGEIIYSERYPIDFGKTLRETVEKNLEQTRKRAIAAVPFVCENFFELRNKASVQSSGKNYTTPTFFQFLKMLKNHKLLLKRCKGS